MDSGTENNPIKIFFSAPNARALYEIIQKGLQERYKTTVDDKYMEQLIEIMQYVTEPLRGKRIPVTTDKKWLVQTLNKQVIDEALPLFAKIVQKPESQQPIVPPKRAAEVLTRPQSTPIRALGVDDDEEKLEALVQERTVRMASQPAAPNFEDELVEYPDDINDLYELEEQARQNNDTLPHPEVGSLGSSDLPFDPLLVRQAPTSYNADPAPRGSERALATPIEVLNFNQASPEDIPTPPPPPPQPTELRVMIPTDSRNLIADSLAIPHTFVVHSSDRNQTIYPSPSQYRLELRDPYIDVVSVELASAVLPLSGYNINASNNILYFEEVGGTTLTAVIPVGNYPDSAALALAIATSLTAASTGGVTYTSMVDMLTGKITITSDGFGGAIFTLIFFGAPSVEGRPQYPENSIGPVLGFMPEDYTGALSYEAPNFPNLDGEANIYLVVEEFAVLESNNAFLHNAFACIPLCSDDSAAGCGYARFAPHDNFRFVKYFSPPKGKLAYLTVSFRTETGALYDFNGRDHSFILTITIKDVTQPVYRDPEH